MRIFLSLLDISTLSVFSILESDVKDQGRMGICEAFVHHKQSFQWLAGFSSPHNSLLKIVSLIICSYIIGKRLTSKCSGVMSHFIVERKENLFYFVVFLTC